MYTFVRTRKPNSDVSGFSLIELLVVVTILAVLAAIAIPTFLNQQKKAGDGVAQSNATNTALFLQSAMRMKPTTATVTPGTEGIATGDILIDGIAEPKNGSVVFVNAATQAWCVSQQAPKSNKIFSASSATTNGGTYESTGMCTGTTTAPTAGVNTGGTVISTIGNLVSANAATGTDTLNNTTDYNSNGNFALTSDSTYASQGTKSLKMVATNTGSAYVTHGGITTNGTIPVVNPNLPYTFTVKALSPTITRNFLVRIYWYTSTGTQIYSVPSTAKPISSSWQTFSLTATAPANATSASVMLMGNSIAIGETLWTDEWGLWSGTGGQWALPGVNIYR